MKKRVFFPHIGARGRHKIFLLLAILGFCEGSLGLALTVLAAKPLSIIAPHLAGLDLHFPSLLKAQFIYGLSIAFFSVISIQVANHCVNSYNMSAVKRAQIIWSSITVAHIVLTIVAAATLLDVMPLGSMQIVATFEGGMSQYLLDSNWKSRFDKVQQELKCCGVTNHKDWLKMRWIPIQSLKPTAFQRELMTVDGRIKKPVLPASCCSPYYDVPCIHDFLQQEKMSTQKDQDLFPEGVFFPGCIGNILDPMLTAFTSFCYTAIPICIFQAGRLIISNVLYYICTSH